MKLIRLQRPCPSPCPATRLTVWRSLRKARLFHSAAVSNMAREKRLPRTTSHMALNQAQLIRFWTTGRVNRLKSQEGCHFFFFLLNSQQHQEHLFTSLHFLIVKILYIFIKNKQAEYCFTPTPCQKIFNSAFLKSGTLWWQRSINIEHTQTNITNKHYIIQYFATRTWTILFC